MVARANRRNATASRSIANDASAAAIDAPDTPATVDAFAASSSSADDDERLDDFLLGSSPLGSPDTNAIVGETCNDVDVNAANDCDDTIVNDKEEDVDESEFLPNAAVNDDTILVDAPNNDANEEGEDTNMEEDSSLDAQDDTPADDSDNADEEGEPPAVFWNHVKIYTAKDILKSNAVKCMGDKCRLVACSIWSSTLDPEEPWFSCLGKLLCTITCFILLLHTIRDNISSTLHPPHSHAHSSSPRLPGKFLRWLGRQVTHQRTFR
jgi:hypothetical protein